MDSVGFMYMYICNNNNSTAMNLREALEVGGGRKGGGKNDENTVLVY